MVQTDLVAGFGLVSGSSFSISSICVVGQPIFQVNQLCLFKTLCFGCMELGRKKKKKPVQLPWISDSMVKSQYAYQASLLS